MWSWTFVFILFGKSIECTYITTYIVDPNQNNNLVKETLKLSGEESEDRQLIEWLCNDYSIDQEECNQLYDYMMLQPALTTTFISNPTPETIHGLKYNAHSSFPNGTLFRERKPLALSAYSTAAVAAISSSSSDNWPMRQENTSYRTIWTLWWQGWKHAPRLVQKCYQSWKQHHPDWHIMALDKDSVSQFFSLSEYFPHFDLTNTTGSRITSWSDIIRVGLLFKYGGVWIDSTVFCHQPLTSFLWHQRSSGFYAFDGPGSNLFANWFMSSSKGGYITQRLFEATIQYWEKRDNAHMYFWFRELFRVLYYTDKVFANLWDTRQPILPIETFHLMHLFRDMMSKERHTLSIDVQHLVNFPGEYLPMSKLTYKNNHVVMIDDVLLGNEWGSVCDALKAWNNVCNKDDGLEQEKHVEKNQDTDVNTRKKTCVRTSKESCHNNQNQDSELPMIMNNFSSIHDCSKLPTFVACTILMID